MLGNLSRDNGGGGAGDSPTAFVLSVVEGDPRSSAAVRGCALAAESWSHMMAWYAVLRDGFHQPRAGAGGTPTSSNSQPKPPPEPETRSSPVLGRDPPTAASSQHQVAGTSPDAAGPSAASTAIDDSSGSNTGGIGEAMTRAGRRSHGARHVQPSPVPSTPAQRRLPQAVARSSTHVGGAGAEAPAALAAPAGTRVADVAPAPPHRPSRGRAVGSVPAGSMDASLGHALSGDAGGAERGEEMSAGAEAQPPIPVIDPTPARQASDPVEQQRRGHRPGRAGRSVATPVPRVHRRAASGDGGASNGTLDAASTGGGTETPGHEAAKHGVGASSASQPASVRSEPPPARRRSAAAQAEAVQRIQRSTAASRARARRSAGHHREHRRPRNQHHQTDRPREARAFGDEVDAHSDKDSRPMARLRGSRTPLPPTSTRRSDHRGGVRGPASAPRARHWASGKQHVAPLARETEDSAQSPPARSAVPQHNTARSGGGRHGWGLRDQQGRRSVVRSESGVMRGERPVTGGIPHPVPFRLPPGAERFLGPSALPQRDAGSLGPGARQHDTTDAGTNGDPVAPVHAGGDVTTSTSALASVVRSAGEAARAAAAAMERQLQHHRRKHSLPDAYALGTEHGQATGVASGGGGPSERSIDPAQWQLGFGSLPLGDAPLSTGDSGVARLGYRLSHDSPAPHPPADLQAALAAEQVGSRRVTPPPPPPPRGLHTLTLVIALPTGTMSRVGVSAACSNAATADNCRTATCRCWQRFPGGTGPCGSWPCSCCRQRSPVQHRRRTPASSSVPGHGRSVHVAENCCAATAEARACATAVRRRGAKWGTHGHFRSRFSRAPSHRCPQHQHARKCLSGRRLRASLGPQCT